ncbi:MAG: NUDIX hydrolase [Candidatus Lokiarchaeota archaeon]
MNNKISNWKTVEERTIFKNKFIGLRNDRAQRPDGVIVDYVVVEMHDFATVICQNELGKIVLVHQYRYPWHDISWETPSGLLEEGETPDEAALREVEEESGYKVKDLTFLLKFRPNGITKAFCYLYFANVISGGNQSLDPNEFIEVEEFNPEEIDKLIKKEKIIHGPTITGWLAVKNKNLIK